MNKYGWSAPISRGNAVADVVKISRYTPAEFNARYLKTTRTYRDPPLKPAGKNTFNFNEWDGGRYGNKRATTSIIKMRDPHTLNRSYLRTQSNLTLPNLKPQTNKNRRKAMENILGLETGVQKLAKLIPIEKAKFIAKQQKTNADKAKWKEIVNNLLELEQKRRDGVEFDDDEFDFIDSVDESASDWMSDEMDEKHVEDEDEEEGDEGEEEGDEGEDNDEMINFTEVLISNLKNQMKNLSGPTKSKISKVITAVSDILSKIKSGADIGSREIDILKSAAEFSHVMSKEAEEEEEEESDDEDKKKAILKAKQKIAREQEAERRKNDRLKRMEIEDQDAESNRNMDQAYDLIDRVIKQTIKISDQEDTTPEMLKILKKNMEDAFKMNKKIIRSSATDLREKKDNIDRAMVEIEISLEDNLDILGEKIKIATKNEKAKADDKEDFKISNEGGIITGAQWAKFSTKKITDVLTDMAIKQKKAGVLDNTSEPAGNWRYIKGIGGKLIKEMSVRKQMRLGNFRLNTETFSLMKA